MSYENSPYQNTEFSDESAAAKKKAADDAKKAYNRAAARKSRAAKKIETQKQKAKEVEEGRLRAHKLAEEERVASGEKARAERRALIVSELTPPTTPMDDEYKAYFENEVETYLLSRFGAALSGLELSSFEKVYLGLLVTLEGRLILQHYGVEVFPLREGWTFIVGSEIQCYHKATQLTLEFWEVYKATAAELEKKVSDHLKSRTIERMINNYSPIVPPQELTEYERSILSHRAEGRAVMERKTEVDKQSAWRNALRALRAQWDAGRRAAKVAT